MNRPPNMLYPNPLTMGHLGIPPSLLRPLPLVPHLAESLVYQLHGLPPPIEREPIMEPIRLAPIASPKSAFGSPPGVPVESTARSVPEPVIKPLSEPNTTTVVESLPAALTAPAVSPKSTLESTPKARVPAQETVKTTATTTSSTATTPKASVQPRKAEPASDHMEYESLVASLLALSEGYEPTPRPQLTFSSGSSSDSGAESSSELTQSQDDYSWAAEDAIVIWRCKFCSKQFDSSQGLGGHMSRSHEGEKKRAFKELRHATVANEAEETQVDWVDDCGMVLYACKYCDKIFDSSRGLGGHVSSVHGRQKTTYPCSTCGMVFDNRMALGGHTYKEHRVKKKSRGLRARALSASTRAMDLAQIANQTEKSVCRYCDKVFDKKQGLIVHMARVHASVNIESRRAHAKDDKESGHGRLVNNDPVDQHMTDAPVTTTVEPVARMTTRSNGLQKRTKDEEEDLQEEEGEEDVSVDIDDMTVDNGFYSAVEEQEEEEDSQDGSEPDQGDLGILSLISTQALSTSSKNRLSGRQAKTRTTAGGSSKQQNVKSPKERESKRGNFRVVVGASGNKQASNKGRDGSEVGSPRGSSVSDSTPRFKRAEHATELSSTAVSPVTKPLRPRRKTTVKDSPSLSDASEDMLSDYDDDLITGSRSSQTTVESSRARNSARVGKRVSQTNRNSGIDDPPMRTRVRLIKPKANADGSIRSDAVGDFTPVVSSSDIANYQVDGLWCCKWCGIMFETGRALGGHVSKRHRLAKQEERERNGRRKRPSSGVRHQAIEMAGVPVIPVKRPMKKETVNATASTSATTKRKLSMQNSIQDDLIEEPARKRSRVGTGSQDKAPEGEGDLACYSDLDSETDRKRRSGISQEEVVESTTTGKNVRRNRGKRSFVSDEFVYM
eukprot:GILJ01009395.1.p1 GENE.GILJ01009395.1~~GILJ01009395.1.p1  ORF type:complete len:1049 (-),score=214.94 GILJ01009395.1:238-2922(-)